MTELWTTLVPIALVTALLPVEIAITILMLREQRGVARAAAWIGGMTLVRLVQYPVMLLVLDPAVDDGQPGTSPVEGALLLVVATLLLVSAGRKLAKQPDEDAPPPGWMTTAASLTPVRAFLAGAGLVALSPKLWAFILAAIGAIADAELEPWPGWVAFLVFVVLAQSTHFAALGLAVVAPVRSRELLEAAGDALERHSRPVMIAISALFGIWFVLKALRVFGLF
jgi:threonine/homoserine/homoserine lactone efflux protein